MLFHSDTGKASGAWIVLLFRSKPGSLLLGVCLHFRNGGSSNLGMKDQLSKGGLDGFSVSSVQFLLIDFKNSVFSKEHRDENSSI